MQKNLEKRAWKILNCSTGISLLLFSQLCVFHHNKAGGVQLDSVTIDTTGQQQSKNAQQLFINEDGLLGKVWRSNTSQPICVPGNSALTLPGRLGKNTKIPSGTSYPVDTAVVNNLPQVISVNHCLAHPKGNVVPVIIINQNNHNVWIQQQLLVAEIFLAQHIP